MSDDVLEQIGRDLIIALGDNPDRPGLVDTPRRWAAWWREFVMAGLQGNSSTTFHAEGADQLVVISGIKVWSICEHHLLPFSCDLTVATIPGDRLLGLSKFARIAHRCAASLQVQERLVEQIADQVVEAAETSNVAVIGSGEHLCMTMRGVRTPARMTTSVMRGAFRDKPEARAELLSLLELNR